MMVPLPGGPAPPAVAEILVWRMIGASVWHALIFLFILAPLWAVVLPSASASLMTSLTGWFSLTSTSAYIFLYALQFSVLFTQHMVLSPSEAAPLHLPHFGLHSRFWLTPLIPRILLRGRRAQDIIAVAALLASSSFSAASFIYTYSQLRFGGTPAVPSLALCSTYGLLLGLLFSVQHLAGWVRPGALGCWLLAPTDALQCFLLASSCLEHRCRDVLEYPAIQRHRYFQLKQRLPSGTGARHLGHETS